MSAPLTAAGEATVAELAARYHVSVGAVRTLLDAVIRGGGSMAQFSHPDLGGSGQWLRGGMTMVGDMFNSGLQSTVSGICSELSSQLSGGALLTERPESASGGSSTGYGAPSGFGSVGSDWWPADLGRPSSSGGQNDSAYAYFPSTRRLAIRRGGVVTLYDTADHQISGVQQQQGGRGSLEFSSQRGTFTVDSLQLADADGSGQSAERPAAETVNQPAPVHQPVAAPAPAERPAPTAERPTPAAQPAPDAQAPVAVHPVAAAPAPTPPAPTSPAPVRPQGGASTAAEIGSAIETLAGLRDKGFLTEDEFSAKKTELLTRL